MAKDHSNITFRSDTEKVYGLIGLQFHAEKYLPKLERVKRHLPVGSLRSLDVGIIWGGSQF